MDFEIIKQLINYAGPGVALGFFMAWYFFSREYSKNLLHVIENNSKVMSELSTIIKERTRYD